MHVPGTVRGWILPPWEGGPVRLSSSHTVIACHGEAASPVVGRSVDAQSHLFADIAARGKFS